VTVFETLNKFAKDYILAKTIHSDCIFLSKLIRKHGYIDRKTNYCHVYANILTVKLYMIFFYINTMPFSSIFLIIVVGRAFLHNTGGDRF
jgi:hypothetical protein